MRILAACGLFLMAVSLSGCNIAINAVQGSGQLATDVRDVSEFQSIRLYTSVDVVVQVGESTTLEVEGDDNLCELISTEVSGDGWLTISSNKSFSTRNPITVRITTPSLENVELAGSGDITVEGLTGDRFDAQVSGSGDIIASGTADRIEAAVAGSGSIDMSELKAAVADATVSGSGDIIVCANKEVTATVSGSGEIEYSGHSGQKPDVSTTVNGSGDVSARH
ncbi:MAG: head GIN domain-containing protein [Planctomycetaceae bacterium]